MTSGIASAASVAPAMMSPLTLDGSIGRMPPRSGGALLRWLVADEAKTSLPPPTAGTGALDRVARLCSPAGRRVSATRAELAPLRLSDSTGGAADGRCRGRPGGRRYR